jgi:predicted dehydrogenase
MSKVWLVGAGPMAQEYVKVFNDIGLDYLIIGRSESSANQIRSMTVSEVIEGGYEQFLSSNPNCPQFAIVCLQVHQLADCAVALLQYGIKNILLEKPAGNSKDEILVLAELEKKYSANLFVAYNRRFYSSVYKAKEIIEQDGGLSSCHFEFTEWWHKIKDLNKPVEVFDKWLIGNSSHVIDMAFHLIGRPKEISCYSSGSVEHHNKSGVFVGSGISESKVLFSYIADWSAPGRWSIELLTPKHRIVLKPLEEVKVIKLGTVNEEAVVIDDALDKQFKPGLYKQTIAFINLDTTILCTMKEQAKNVETYYKIANY